MFLIPSEENQEDPPVVKIVPVDGETLVNSQPQTQLMDILAEIVISSELSKLSSKTTSCGSKAPGFLTVLSCNLTEGAYPDDLLDKWDHYDAEKGSENDRPDASLFGLQQKFVVLELKNGGQDLENVTLTNAAQGYAVFQQVAHALAIAEESLKFEHRDLHWGNILIRDCVDKVLSYQLQNNNDDHQFEVETSGVMATIIDFSLSRMTSPQGWEIFINLADDTDLFKSEGDYQFEVYRMMKVHTGDDWKGFHPKTNVMWLHYLLDKLTSEVFYKNKKSKTHRSSLSKMRILKENFLETYDSAYHYVLSCSEEN